MQILVHTNYISKNSTIYILQVIAENLPDPGVTRLQDGSGWALVATSEHASKQDNSSAFPLYFSEGNYF